MSDVVAVFSWWLTLFFAGLAVLPLSYRLFQWLPDRGFAFTKTLGLLLISYLFWLLNSFGLLHNSTGGILFSVAVVTVFSLQVYRTRMNANDESLLDWIRKNSGYVILVELFFAICFAGWCVYRAYNPDIAGTEKPMDLAFIQSIIRSDTFPPQDPWLSGFAISYYYFGYAMTAMLAKITNISGTVAFNIGLAWQFAGTLLGGFGLIFNLVAAARKNRTALVERWQVMYGVLGGLFIGVMGNLEGFLEVLHANNILPYGFWKWLDILDINGEPPTTFKWPPRGTWWWWRASRVIHDRWLPGQSLDSQNNGLLLNIIHGRFLEGESMGLHPIDEFPFFSFLLGDMHPHVLALPFVLLVLALAVNWWLKRWELDKESSVPPLDWIKLFIQQADPVFLVLYAVCLGSLGFLNTWDFPFYLFVTVGAFVLANLRDGGLKTPLWDTGLVVESTLAGIMTVLFGSFALSRLLKGEFSLVAIVGVSVLTLSTVGLVRLALQRQKREGQWVLGSLGKIILVGAGLLVTGVLAYLPFYYGFRSQAGGLLPNVINPTRLPQFFVMFGPFLFILVFWLLDQVIRSKVSWQTFYSVAIGLLLVLLVITGVSAGLAFTSPFTASMIDQVANDAGGMDVAAKQTIFRRLVNPWTALFLMGMIGSVIVLWQTNFLGIKSEKRNMDGRDTDSNAPFVLLLVLTAALLTLAPEFIYLKDNFGARMNTIFKFYYQAWVLFAVSGCYAMYVLLSRKGALGFFAGVGMVLLVGAGLVYPVLSIETRVSDITGGPTLDGMAYMERVQPSDYAVIRWLQENVEGNPVILEAVDGQYTWGGRISAHTGLPTLLGWAGHEYQWRGDTNEPAIREQDIKTMYTARTWAETQQLLDRYHVEYVIVGQLEISTFGEAVVTNFERSLETVFQTDGATIYRWNSLAQ